MGFGVYHLVLIDIGVFSSSRFTGLSPELFSLSVSGDNKGTALSLAHLGVANLKPCGCLWHIWRSWSSQQTEASFFTAGYLCDIPLRSSWSGLLTANHVELTHRTSTQPSNNRVNQSERLRSDKQVQTRLFVKDSFSRGHNLQRFCGFTGQTSAHLMHPVQWCSGKCLEVGFTFCLYFEITDCIWKMNKAIAMATICATFFSFSES